MRKKMSFPVAISFINWAGFGKKSKVMNKNTRGAGIFVIGGMR